MRPPPLFASLLAHLLGALLVLGLGCGDDSMIADAAPDGSVDGGDGGGDGAATCRIPDLTFGLSNVGSVVGVERETYAELSLDYCEDLTVTLTSSDPSVATVPDALDFSAADTRVQFVITPVTVGTTTITGRVTIRGMDKEASLEVQIVDATLPSCDGSASGDLAHGDVLEVTDGSLTGALLELPEGASRDDAFHVDPFTGSIACAPDQLPDGYLPLGPAVTFGPAHGRFDRELPMGLPMRTALLPAGANRGHVEVSYTGPGVADPRIVPVAVSQIPSAADGLFRFEARRLGTYQVVVRDTAGTPREREFTFRGILGLSMGGIGTGIVGFRNPERFDFAGPQGAAWDWSYLLDYSRAQHLGGFCTEEERVADPSACASASASRSAPVRWMYEVKQDFEHWNYDENIRVTGHGTDFGRPWYADMLTDLSYMYGSPNYDATPDGSPPNVLPPGVPDSRRLMSDADWCATPQVIPPHDGSPSTGFFDDEYNPEGLHPVITFCDGAEASLPDGDLDLGVWDPDGANDEAMRVLLAVDVDADGVRDPGEPVIRNFREEWDDCGVDRLCNPDETGYDAVTNPDPAGDDYDYQYNPLGTEGNRLRDGDRCDASAGEAFLDFGLDGVLGTAQLVDGGFDNGEGDGCWTVSHGMQRMLDRGPKKLLLTADEDELADLDVFADGGIRDLFMAGPAANHMSAAFPGRNQPLRYHNGYSRFHLDHRANDIELFRFTEIDWLATGQNVLVRYGDVDAPDSRIQNGDGAHVGLIEQALNRILAPVVWMSQRWPDGDRTRVIDSICDAGSAGCENPNKILLDFTAPSTGRTGPAAIILPPGYYDEEFADVSYPVVYFLHGYGMNPTQVIDIAVILWNFMIAPTIPESQRVQKMIFVFPDGSCNGDECVRGTFYTDAPEGTPGGAQMETFLLDLMDHVDANYRTRPAETFTVVE